MGWWTALCVVLAVVGFFVPDGRGPDKAPDGWLAVALVGPLWLFVVLIATETAYGRALLTSEGIRFHTWVSHRFVPWREVTDVEIRFHRNSRSIGVRRRHGRRLIVPGTVTVLRRRGSFDENLRTIKRYWSHAGGPQH